MKYPGASRNSLIMSMLSWDAPNLQIARAVFLDTDNKNTTCLANWKDKQSIEFEKKYKFVPNITYTNQTFSVSLKLKCNKMSYDLSVDYRFIWNNSQITRQMTYWCQYEAWQQRTDYLKMMMVWKALPSIIKEGMILTQCRSSGCPLPPAPTTPLSPLNWHFSFLPQSLLPFALSTLS